MECITFKKNSSRKIEHKNLVTKFLHHSIGGLDSYIGQINNVYNETSSVSLTQKHHHFILMNTLHNKLCLQLYIVSFSFTKTTYARGSISTTSSNKPII